MSENLPRIVLAPCPKGYTRDLDKTMQEATTAHDVYLGDTFAATILPDSRVRRFDNGFSINHGAFGLALTEQPGQIGLNVTPRNGFRPSQVHILPAQKFVQLPKIAGIGLLRGA